MRLSVPTRFLKSWIQSHYAERVLACWQAEQTQVGRIELIVRSAVLRSAIVKPASPSWKTAPADERPLQWPRQWPAAAGRRSRRA